MAFVREHGQAHGDLNTNRRRSPMLIVIQSFVRLFESLIYPADRATPDHNEEDDFYDVTSRRNMR
jgi:hypothetical protein